MTTSEIEELLARLRLSATKMNYDYTDERAASAVMNEASSLIQSLLADRKALLEAVEEIAAMAVDEGNLNWGHAQDAIDIARAARDGVAR